MRKLITRVEIAELLEMSRSQIRFYEKKGLLNPSKNEKGYAMYNFDDLDRLELIKLLSDLNTPIKEIKRILDNEDPYDYPSLLERSYENINDEISRLEKQRHLIKQKLKSFIEDEVNVFKLEHYEERIVYIVKDEAFIHSVKDVYDLLKKNNLRHLDYENELYSLMRNNKEYFGIVNPKVKPVDDKIVENKLEAGDYFSHILSYSYEEAFEIYEKEFRDEAKKRGYVLDDTLIFIDHFKRKFYEKHRFIGTLQARVVYVE